MSHKSKIFLLAVAASIAVVLLIGFVAAGFYQLGRNSVRTESQIEQNGDEIERQSDNQSARDSDSTDASPIIEPTAQDAVPETDAATNSPTTSSQKAIEDSDQESETATLRSTDISQEDLELLLEVWEIIGREFDGAVPANDELTYGAIAGSLDLLNDQFTRFVPPELAALVREQLQGSFEGIGAFVDMTEDGYLMIVRPIRGQPAELAGIKDGDIVTHVNGESVLGKSVDAIVSEVKGPRGTDVTLTIVRDSVSEPFEITVTRELIELPIVEAETLEDGIAYVRLSSFTGSAASQLEEAVAEQLASEPKALILDLRDNPGGFLSQSVDVADLFLPEGIVLFQRDGTGDEEIFESDDGDLAEEIPLVVLINAGSGSASEIVAGAIQDRDRGILIGETTFGKGSVQKSYTLSDGSELRVTISRWFTPENNSISEVGITPDILVDTPEIFGREDDDQLQRAIEYLLTGS